jgi:hypothetical protein
MSWPNTPLRAGFILTIFSACVADDATVLETADGTESADGALADPDPYLDPFLNALDRVEFSSDDSSRIELLAYDADDQLVGTLALQYAENGTVQFVAEFDDGAALVEIEDGSVITRHSDLPDVVVARRAEAIGLEIDSGVQARWWKCAGMTALTVHNCSNPATALWACGVSSFLAACECLDYLADKYEWRHDEC